MIEVKRVHLITGAKIVYFFLPTKNFHFYP